MRKFVLAFLLITTAANPAAADPVTLGALASLGSSISAFAASSALAGFAVNLAGSVLLGLVSKALRGGDQKPDAPKQKLQTPSSLPAYRFWYGDTIATTTILQMGVDGGNLYGCVLLNSRPSDSIETIFLDNRPLAFDGDIYDLATGGLANNGHWGDHPVRMWVGRGDQDGPPPLIVAQMPDLFAATDAWHGRTVLWYKISFGANDEASWKWPSRPPVVTVKGKWSKVWDARDPAQNPDDPSTWLWQDNQPLCLLDFYRCNPIKTYPLAAIHLPSFTAAADLADEPIALSAGGTEPRYRVAGVIVFDGSEIEAQAQPLHDAGASRPTWIGGQMGLVPGGAIASSFTITDVLDLDGMEYTRYRPAAEMITTVRTTYIAEDRNYEPAELTPYVVPGAQAADGGLERVVNLDLLLVPSPTQAMRLQKIKGLMGRLQRQVSGTLPPYAFDLVSGSVVTLDLPAPFTGRNGVYQVQTINPTVSLLGDDGQVALRCPVTLLEYFGAIYDWDISEEQALINPGFNPDRAALTPPGAITTVTGTAAALDIGIGLVPRIRFAFDPSPSAVDGYEWQYRQSADSWQSGGTIGAAVRDDAGQVFGYVPLVEPGQDYDIRVRAVAGGGASEWVEVLAVIAAGPSASLTAPEPVSANPSAGKIAVTFEAPNNPNHRATEIWASAVNTAGTGAPLAGSPVYGAPSATVKLTENGLAAAQTRYYFARSLDAYGAASAFSASISATTP